MTEERTSRPLLRTRWLLLHLVVVGAVAALAVLTLSELNAADDEAAENERVERESKVPAVALSEMLSLVERDGAEAHRYRKVRVVGTFDPDVEFTVPDQKLGASEGLWVVTPLDPVGDGPAILVSRGWVPAAMADDEPPVDGVEVPRPEVTLDGYLEPTRPLDTPPPDGALSSMARVDVARFAEQYEGPVEPRFFVQMQRARPATSGDLKAVPVPDLDIEPAGSLAWLWGATAVVILAGYLMLLWFAARQRRKAEFSA